jgi:hypothetical protein
VLFIWIFLITASQAFSFCEVSLPEKLIIIHSNFLTSTFKAQNCDPSTLNNLTVLISKLEGRTNNFLIEEAFKNQFGQSIKIQPYLVHILHLESLIRTQLNVNSQFDIAPIDENFMNYINPMSSNDEIKIVCPDCKFKEKDTLYLELHKSQGLPIKLAFNIFYKTVVKAFKVSIPIPAFSEISNINTLEEHTTSEIPHTKLITDITQLRFYKTNKHLNVGDLLKTSDLTPINLVRAGVKTEIILENNLVRIKTSGLSKSNGHIGQFVEVYHPEKNKKYFGKVIEFNKVLVEL